MSRAPTATQTSLDAAAALRAALEAMGGAEPVVAVAVVQAPAAQPAAPGRRMLVWQGRREGSLGEPGLDEAAARRAREVLAGAAGGVLAVGETLLYLERYAPPPELLIVGAGHIARPLCTLGALLGFRVQVLDDRPDFATRERFPEAAALRRADFADPLRGLALGPASHLVLVTRGHKYDFEVLRRLLALPEQPAYVGMVGSRRRVRAALQQLAAEGIAPERLARIHAPIGLDLGAETPEEIALAIAAELVLTRRGGTGAPLRDVARIARRVMDDGRPW